MFGLTAGGVLVYFAPGFFQERKTKFCVSIFACLSSFCILTGLLSLFFVPALFNRLGLIKILMPVLYGILSLQFMAIGVCLSLALSRFPAQVGKIYGVNLIGSALGCVGVIFILNNLNAPSAIFWTAGLCALSALLFAMEAGTKAIFKFFLAAIVALFIVFSAINSYFDIIRPVWAKGMLWPTAPFYRKWNFFSYITLDLPSVKPFGWGYSPNISSYPIKTQELMLLIDEGAGTVLTRFDDPKDLEYLKLDISSIAHYVRAHNDVLVIGSGAGRDLLTAAIFGAKNITGVEMNQDVVDIAFNKFKNFSYGINKFPQINIKVDEGRSFVSRSKNKYDLIQASMVDTGAAAAQGAFALSENSIYTTDAWIIFLEHLTDKGILTFSRWYSSRDPTETYRLLTLAKASLRYLGIRDIRSHVALVRNPPSVNTRWEIGTILVSMAPFSSADLENLKKACDDLRFELVLSPEKCTDDNIKSILQAEEDRYKLANLSANIDPTSDNRPFYFYFSNFRDIFSRAPAYQGAAILKKSLLMIIIYALFFLIVPLSYYRIAKIKSGMFSFAAIVYFSGIGFAFMFIEIPLIQRLGMFLGHPVYGFTVVLFGLLSACGIGSFIAKSMVTRLKVVFSFCALLALIFFAAYMLPCFLRMMDSWGMTGKIFISFLCTAVLGLFMGIPFPLMMARFFNSESNERLLYWAVNGFTSVCGSAFALIVSIHFGFQAAILAGGALYLAAFLSYLIFQPD